MQYQILEISIPERQHAAAATLRVKLTYKNKESLATKPYVFMFPGGPGGNHSNYADYDCLHGVANIVYYDPRGCGLSDKCEPATYTMHNYIDDAHIIKETLKIDTFILLGKSYGAMSALGYTLRYPQDVSKLVLAAGTHSYTFLATAKKNILARGTAEQQDICRNLFAGNFANDEHMAQFFKIMAPVYSWKVRRDEPVNRPKPTHPFAFEVLNAGFSKQFWQFDFTEQLHRIVCPTLILVGSEDWITDPIYSQTMAKKIANSTLHIFPNSDHSMESDVPQLFFNTIRSFIESATTKT